MPQRRGALSFKRITGTSAKVGFWRIASAGFAAAQLATFQHFYGESSRKEAGYDVEEHASAGTILIT